MGFFCCAGSDSAEYSEGVRVARRDGVAYRRRSRATRRGSGGIEAHAALLAGRRSANDSDASARPTQVRRQACLAAARTGPWTAERLPFKRY